MASGLGFRVGGFKSGAVGSKNQNQKLDVGFRALGFQSENYDIIFPRFRLSRALMLWPS